MTIRVVIADDHPVVRAGLRGMLGSEPDFEVVGEAADGAEAVDAALHARPDVVLMDLRMPRVDGIAATARIRDRDPAIRVLVLTTYDTDADIVRAIEAGATGYVLKDARREELFRAVRAVAAGASALAPGVASRVIGRMRAPGEETLSAREIEVLELVAKGCSNKEVASALAISEATVKTHLLHVFSKLGVQDRTEAVTAALSRGILRLDG